LLGHSLWRLRTLVLTMALLLAGFQVVLIFVAGSLEGSGAFEQLAALLPPFARELLGSSMASFLSFAGIVCLGYFHLAPMGALVALAITVATMPAAEVESGFADLILARPLARHWIVTRTLAATVLVTALLLAVMMTATWAGLNALAPREAQWPSARLIVSLAANLGMLLLCWSGVALAIASASRRRALAGGSAGVLALAAFLLDYVGRLWQPAESAARLSPFRYFSPLDLVMGAPLPPGNLAVLGGIAAAGFLAAYVLYARRDITH
jgi:ABC-2 type transport system permease protein